MGKNWFNSLRCNSKSSAYDDVYNSLITCRNSYSQIVKDVHHSKPKPTRPGPYSSKKEHTKGHVRLSELEEGDVTKKVYVDTLFDIRWGPEGFPGRVEKVFKIHNPARLTARFEEYRDLVKLRAKPGYGARFHCTTAMMNGNEMTRFHPTADIMDYMDACHGAMSDLLVSTSTYFQSGLAHHSVPDTCGEGRRAMVISRVIAGRVVEKGSDLGESDSVEGENGELFVSDSRAVLPCYLVIYTL